MVLVFSAATPKLHFKAFRLKNQMKTATLAHSLCENGASIAHYKKLCNKNLVEIFDHNQML